MQSIITAFERWLRIDPARSPMRATRARAIYTLTFVFVGTQLLNLVGMWVDYGRWTVDHAVAIGAMAFSVGMMIVLRWCKKFTAYAFGYVAAMVTGVALSAAGVGINSALLPVIAWVPFAAGMMAGWRTVLFASGASLALLVWLYWVSMTDPIAVANQTGGEFQRLSQATFAVVVAGAMATVFSYGLRTALTSLQATAERARRAEAAKSDFLAQMSHELRTPLNGVIGLSDALAAGDLGDRERALTETIRSSGQSLLAILNDLLDLSKIEAGKLQVEAAAFAPGDLARSVAETWREAGAARGTSVTATVDGAPDWLLGDELRIRQVLNNFVSNAVKFTEGGAVALSLHATPALDGTRLVFRVADTGCGIPADRRDAVFEPFEQAGAGTAKRYGGTGLGLPICRKLAGLMGGEVALERSGPGGTVFAFALTLPEARTPAAAAGRDAEDVSGLRVLVADDNAVNRLVAAEFLRALGVEAVFAENGDEAVTAASLGGFDAVLMDKHMPGLDGIAATHAIRALAGEAGAVPIIAVPADAMAGAREALLAEGMDGYLSKPLKLDALRDALTAAAARPAPEARPAQPAR